MGVFKYGLKIKKVKLKQPIHTHGSVALTRSIMNSCGTAKFSICRITLSRKSQAACTRATLYHTFHIITCRRVKYINYVIILMAQTVSQTAISRSWLACMSALTEPDYQSPDTIWEMTGCCYGAIWITPLKGETTKSFPQWFITQRQVGLQCTERTISFCLKHIISLSCKQEYKWDFA